jgi:hypothetical protein
VPWWLPPARRKRNLVQPSEARWRPEPVRPAFPNESQWPAQNGAGVWRFSPITANISSEQELNLLGEFNALSPSADGPGAMPPFALVIRLIIHADAPAIGRVLNPPAGTVPPDGACCLRGAGQCTPKGVAAVSALGCSIVHLPTIKREIWN